MEKETILWEDKKHHLWFPLSFTKYTVMDGRLLIRSGLLSTTTEETLLYRIVDITMKQTLSGRLFGTGTIILSTKVDSTPRIVLENIRHPEQVRHQLSEWIEESRQSRSVVGKEFYGSGGVMDADGDGIPDYLE